MNENAKSKGRSAIYGMAGFYLLYTAYQIFQNRAESSGVEYVLILIGAAGFVLIGAGMIGFGFYTIYQIRKKEQEALSDDDPDAIESEAKED